MSPKGEVQRFLAKTGSGKKYMIIQYEEESSITSSTTGKHEESTASYTTVTGLAVEHINPTTFKIVETGEYVKKA